MEEKNGYKYTKQWFDFAEDNFEIIKPIDGILYLYCVEMTSRLQASATKKLR